LLLKYLSHCQGLARFGVALDKVHLIEQPLNSILFEKIVLAHLSFNIGKIDQRDELDKELSLQARLGGDKHPLAAEPLLDIPDFASQQEAIKPLIDPNIE